MGTPEDGTDEDSIKPVSSLRSLFENKGGYERGPTPPLNLPDPRSTARHDAAQPITRASLDIPRPTSPWSSSENASVPQRHGTPSAPLSFPRRPNSRLLHRPLSTTALSEPRSPPLLTVESPQSPPKPLRATGTEPVARPSLARPLTPGRTCIRSPLVAPVPPNRLSSTVSTDLQLSLAETKVRTHEPAKANRSLEDRPISPTTKNLPPQINRADKPRFPTKPIAITTSTNKVSLEPVATSVAERVSPFSTPPSSDESVGHGSPVHPAIDRHQISQMKASKTSQSLSCSPPRSRSVRDINQNENTVLPVKAQRKDARNAESTQIATLHHAMPEDRPQLPPRKGRDQRTAAPLPYSEPRASPNRISQRPAMHISPRNSSTQLHGTKSSMSDFLPPPKRAPLSIAPGIPDHKTGTHPHTPSQLVEPSFAPESNSIGDSDTFSAKYPSPASSYPDASTANRRPPYCRRGKQEIGTGYDCRQVAICGQYVATAGHLTRAWDLATGDMVLSLGHLEGGVRVTCLEFKPGATTSEEGRRLWLGTNYGELQEVDVMTKSIVATKTGPHEHRELVRIYRHQKSMWTLDDGGKLCVWSDGEAGLPDLQRSPSPRRMAKGHSFSIKIQDTLWLATGKDIRIFQPSASESTFSVLKEPLGQPGVGPVTSGAIVSGQLDRVYFGHADGKVTIYSTVDYQCLGVITVSVYKIGSLAGAGFHLWAGYYTGMIYVYDTRTQPWTIKKEWLAHDNPVINITTDRSSLWKDGTLRVVSLGADNALRQWDGTLEDDWLEDDMQDRDIEYCSFREITALVVTWNAGAATPTHLRYDKGDSQFFPDILKSGTPPDLLIFGFQELVDLEDKRLTAKTLFMGNKKKDPSDQEHMSHQYRAWRDYLVRCVEDTLPSNEPYYLLHTASMVGLFSCVFIKAPLRTQIRNVNVAELKRGMGGLHGNKGALILRFIFDDSSLCLINCHLAAGQTQTVNRNNDLTAILESALLPPDGGSSARGDIYVGGGDGSMVLDNEICILNGDLNYRIDAMGRDTVVKAVNIDNLSKLLERDQLLVSQRRNPGFRVRAFKELPITFAPTYKYDINSDRYDTSEKRRAPAWCDRILYRGPGKIKQIDYRRHELRVSDHRPVSGAFKIRIKKISADKRVRVRQESEQRFEKARDKLSRESKIEYLRDVLGVPPIEAKRLL
ncbi:hypothetical protein N7G274_009434 [Stereocaulon virgatum]|uniref:Inositol polyphosphate-related phosphatase domain-containing protein n=1 Tax=Stereocaulon virgatum TaxID=373712 RepID=A0ABR3ZVS5_9LECA